MMHCPVNNGKLYADQEGYTEDLKVQLGIRVRVPWRIAGMVKEKLSCKELIQKLVKETDTLIKGAGFYV